MNTDFDNITDPVNTIDTDNRTDPDNTTDPDNMTDPINSTDYVHKYDCTTIDPAVPLVTTQTDTVVDVHADNIGLIPTPTPATTPTQSYTRTKKFEVVFYVKFRNNRPPEDEIIEYFNTYGVVDHINCPENSNNTFIFMKTLSTTATTKRTYHTIKRIIDEMDLHNRFYISVASSNRNKNQNQN